MKNYLFLIITFIFFSCQEEITLDLPQAEEKLVVEGAIEPGFPPYIILTKNQGYFDPININTYNNLFVNNADSVKVWCYNESGEKDRWVWACAGIGNRHGLMNHWSRK